MTHIEKWRQHRLIREIPFFDRNIHFFFFSKSVVIAGLKPLTKKILFLSLIRKFRNNLGKNRRDSRNLSLFFSVRQYLHHFFRTKSKSLSFFFYFLADFLRGRSNKPYQVGIGFDDLKA